MVVSWRCSVADTATSRHVADDDADDILREDRLADPYPFFSALREAEPVRWNERHRAWFVHRYDDLVWALRHPGFSSDRIRPVWEHGLSEEQRAMRKPTFDILLDWMVFLDPPEHTRLRKLAMPAFSSASVNAMEPAVRGVVEGAIDAVADRDSFDLVTDLAYPIPASVIAELMGVPAEDRDLFKSWSDDILVLVFGAEGNRDRHQRAQQGLVELTDYLRGLVRRYRVAPGDNVITQLLASRELDPPLTEDEIVSTCALLIFGGHETTTNLIANGARVLMAHPEQLSALRANPGLVKSAVEELLRYDGPSKMEMRRMVDDVELRGHTLRRGDAVYLVQAAANRDPDAFDRPDTLELERKPNRHVGFGHGVHHCLGSFLARLEGSLALEALVRRLPGLVPGGDPAWHATLISRGMTTFPVRKGAA